MLATELETGETPSAQLAPQFLFFIRLLVAKVAGDLFEAHEKRMLVAAKNIKPLTPALSPFGGERG
jgi:hypothetical protein